MPAILKQMRQRGAEEGCGILCRFGNPSDTHLSDLDLRVCAEGPGSMEHSWHHGIDHSLCLQLASTVAGESEQSASIATVSYYSIPLRLCRYMPSFLAAEPYITPV